MSPSRALRALLGRVHETDRWLFARQAEQHLPLADAVLPRLTRAADHSKLWVAVAAALAGVGGRRGRRAAVRGLSSVGVASLLANQVGKRLAPRARPPLHRVPADRVARRIPRSGSFPSGHSASAAAFAVGASLEVPELAVPLGVLAAAVCWSRVFTGMHYPSDVVAGAAVGAGAAAVLSLAFPAAEPLRAPAPPRTVGLAARPTGRGLVVVVNHASGRDGRDRHLEHLRAALPDAEIVQPTTGDLVPALRAAAARAEVLGISGGDGSVNAAAAVALDHGLPLAVLPDGTFNHFAGDVGLRSVHDAVRAVRTGSAVHVRVGRVSGPDGFRELFLNTASLGSYPEFVERRERRQGRLGKPLAAALAARSVLAGSTPEELLVDGTPRLVDLLFLGNGRHEPPGLAPVRRPAMDDGILDLRLFDERGRLPVTRLVLDLLLGRTGRSSSFVQQLSTRLDVRRVAPDLLARDGEIGWAPAELHFDVDPRVLTVLVVPRPRRAARAGASWRTGSGARPR